jgi:exopolyphosphatase/guanosine-5'-triphosphate,3'-diphosphate pyrophosphatase
MIIAEYNNKKRLKIIYRERVPLRLGKDAFVYKRFRKESIGHLVTTFSHFNEILGKYNIPKARLRAVGTSAFREAKNGNAVKKLIKKMTGIKIDIISGEEEARIIFLAFQRSWHLSSHPFLLIDMGGGSLEFNLVQNKKLSYSRSVKIGTVRLLAVKEKSLGEYERMLEVVKEKINIIFKKIPKNNHLSLVGTGGNLRTIGKLRKKIFKKSSQDFAKLKEIEQILAKVKSLPKENLLKNLEMKQNRADVIEGAIEIIQRIMTIGKFDKIFLPDIGLAHGLVLQLVIKKI